MTLLMKGFVKSVYIIIFGLEANTFYINHLYNDSNVSRNPINLIELLLIYP